VSGELAVISSTVIWAQPVLRVDDMVQDPVPDRSFADYSIGWVRGEVSGEEGYFPWTDLDEGTEFRTPAAIYW
jgi:hypothetical protein